MLISFLLLIALPMAASQNPSEVLSWCPSAVSLNTFGAAIIRGNQFFDTITGRHHPVIGINYYPRPNAGKLIANNIDFFTEEYRHIWERDLVYFSQLGINTIRLFAVDGSQNHDAFVCALRNLGIRLVIGLSASCADCSLTLDSAPDCYPPALKRRGQQIVAEFSRYDNVLAFSVSNEIGLQLLGTPEVNAPCAKQFIKDMRLYMAGCEGMRQVPVGIAVADRDREANALYYSCQEDNDSESAMAKVEWYGINAYQHCNANSESIRGFTILKRDFEEFNLTVPVVLTEFGCINPSFPEIDGYEAQRDFRQVPLLYSTEYSQRFAGGCVFEYSNERRKTPSPWPFVEYHRQGNFGVGYFGPRLCDDIDTPCVYIPFPQFDALASAYSAIGSSVVPDIGGSDATELIGEDPTCPAEFKRLRSFSWPSDDIPNWPCPAPPVIFSPTPPRAEAVITASSCSAHVRCASLGGDCCPTATGVFLSCCTVGTSEPTPNPIPSTGESTSQNQAIPTSQPITMSPTLIPTGVPSAQTITPFQQPTVGSTVSPSTATPVSEPRIIVASTIPRPTTTPTTEPTITVTTATSAIQEETPSTTPSPFSTILDSPPLRTAQPVATAFTEVTAMPTAVSNAEPVSAPNTIGSTFPPSLSSAAPTIGPQFVWGVAIGVAFALLIGR